MDIKKLARPNVLALEPYSSARDEFQGEANICLDANESPFNTGLNRYPDPYQKELKKAIATMQNVPMERIILGNGSDELIDLLFRAFCVPGIHNCIICPPTYGMYAVSAGINDVPIQWVPQLDGFALDMNGIRNAVNQDTRIIFLCSPNNPTGKRVPNEQIKELLTLPVLVVVDEAYIDFANELGGMAMLEAHRNLLVMQTFSKAWGLAAVRLGAAYGDEEVISLLTKIKPPYNVNELTQQVALRAIANKDQYLSWVAAITGQRDVLKNILETLPVVDEVFESEANFFLVRMTHDAGRVYHYLQQKGIVVRNRSTQHLCDNCLRITIGTMEENLELVEALRQFN